MKIKTIRTLDLLYLGVEAVLDMLEVNIHILMRIITMGLLPMLIQLIR